MSRRREKRRTGRVRTRGEPSGPASSAGPDPRLGFEPLHLALVLGGVVVAVAAYWLLDQGSISAAPVLLVVAYLVLLPIGLALPSRRRRSEEDGSGPN
jgi:hypothetical protein